MDTNRRPASMRTRLCRGLALALLLGCAAAAEAKVYRCVDADGKVVIRDTPCPATPPSPTPPPPAPACTLSADALRAALHREHQFLTRFGDQAAHRRAELADLQDVSGQMRLPLARFDELTSEKKSIDAELEFYRGRPVPARLQEQADRNSAQFRALVDIFRNLEQSVAEIRSRYRCERDTFGMLWASQPPGSSACAPQPCAPR